MPGHFNTSDRDDGCVATTKASDKVAVVGSNESSNAPPAGGVGGAGVFGLSISPGAAGVFGANNSQKGVGVQGNGPEAGISGFSERGAGVRAHSNHATAVEAFAHDPNGNGVLAFNNATGAATAADGSPHGCGVVGITTVPGAAALFGANNSVKGTGVQGNGPERGVSGFSDSGFGVIGQSNKNSGVIGTSQNGQGLTAFSDNDVGLFAKGATFSGVFEGALVVNKGPNPKDPSKPHSPINGSIVINDGNLFVNKGDITLAGADCAEDFDVATADAVEPGTVLVIGEVGLEPCQFAYDRRVAGVVSGAGACKPGMILDRGPSARSDGSRAPVALFGKVYCKVEADSGAVRIGDLLTTSNVLGYAMKALDLSRASGAVLGKALAGIEKGQGIIPILVALQ
jgi:hypothetical protein